MGEARGVNRYCIMNREAVVPSKGVYVLFQVPWEATEGFSKCVTETQSDLHFRKLDMVVF